MVIRDVEKRVRRRLAGIREFIANRLDSRTSSLIFRHLIYLYPQKLLSRLGLMGVGNSGITGLIERTLSSGRYGPLLGGDIHG
jgi:hypothetical protein